ncbi:MAG: hypothetical protein QNI95_10625 [Desulfobacterales bacterium]|nr:hypothetical protein [Desulfobacterales bacterium]
MLPSDACQQVYRDIFENATQVHAALEADGPNTETLNRLMDQQQAAMTQLKQMELPRSSAIVSQIRHTQKQVDEAIKKIEAHRDKMAKDLSRLRYRKNIIGMYGTQSRT